jgi:hypothetical protein
MESVGSFEAKTHLPQLWSEWPRARNSPSPSTASPWPGVRQVIEELKAFSKGNTLGEGITIRDLIEDGRRF